LFLYQSCVDESFGDWKPHLAMLLSNSGNKPAVEMKAILTLGDTLASRNHLYAAQFCYLMGREEFRKDSRLGPLLGYSAAADNVLESTQMTEVYEFALKSQEGPHPSLGLSFLESKLDYAKSLVSYGFVQEALAYCEEITKALIKPKPDDAEVKLGMSTLEIAERIAVADESGSANTTWVAELKKFIADPSACFENSRKMSVVSSQEQSSEHSFTSQSQQLQSNNNDVYDPTQYNQQQQQQQPLPPDLGSQLQYDTSGVSSSSGASGAVNNNNNSNNVLDNTMTGGTSSVPESNWSNTNQMNGGLHISQPPMYNVTQQLSQMSLNTNTPSSTNLNSINLDGNNYSSYDGSYTSGYGMLICRRKQRQIIKWAYVFYFSNNL